jgi:hypothetical protein
MTFRVLANSEAPFSSAEYSNTASAARADSPMALAASDENAMATAASGPSVNLVDFGADPSGATNSDGAFGRAWASIKATGGTIAIPAGTFVFSTKEVLSLPSRRAAEQPRSVNIVGQGMETTILHWPNADGGLKIVVDDFRDSVNIADLTVTTGVPDGGEGIVFYGTDFYGGFQAYPMSTMRRICARGSDGGNQRFYWTRGLGTRGVNGISWYDCMVFGGTPSGEGSGALGRGICVEGMDRTPGAVLRLDIDDPGPQYNFGYGLLYNVYGGQINACDIGFYYGDVVQGVNLYGINFGYCRASIETCSDPSRGVLAQLYVTNCQSGAGLGTQVNLLALLFTLGMTNCTWFLKPGQTGIYMKHAVPFTIQGTSIQGVPDRANNPIIGIDIPRCEIAGGSIIGNILRDLTIGVRLQAQTSGIIVDGNHFGSCDIEVSDVGPRNVTGLANLGERTNSEIVIQPTSPGANYGSRSLAFRSIDRSGTGRNAVFVADPDGNMNLLMPPEKLFAIGSTIVGRSNATITGQMNAGSIVSQGALSVSGPVGFNGANAIGPQTVSGPLVNNEARIADLINVLVNLGLVVNSTTYQ